MPAVAEIHNSSPPSAKITLFRSLFRGREDLYPQRFENKKTGKSGYCPACRNAWVRGICDKPKVKCIDCRYRSFFPVTDETISWHLSGRDERGRDFVMGVYPMLINETCFFLAVDFDKAHWEKDALAFLNTSKNLNIPVALERSRSGKGAHAWIFFEEAVPAIMARKLGSFILTETMEIYPEIGLDSYDRFFPSQDTLPQGGFGNLIALPLQKKAREQKNSVFVNEELIPHADQWEFLSQVRKLRFREVEQIVNQAEAQGRVLGVHLPVDEEGFQTPWARRQVANIPSNVALPESLEIIIGNEIFIPKSGLTAYLKNRLIRLAAFPNPEFYKAQALRLSTREKPRMISCAVEYPEHIALPRGCFDAVQKLFSELKIAMSVREELQKGVPIKAKFVGELRGEQKSAAAQMLKTNLGVLSATTAFGKTVIGAWLIAKRKVNTLVLVHRKQLQEQWIVRLSTFLELPKDAIGRIDGTHKKPSGVIDVALIQSVKACNPELLSQYGHIIVDECHHLPAYSFEQIVRRAKPTYITGLTATPARVDGHHPIMFMRCGPVRYRVDARRAAELHPFDHAVFVRPTSFSPTRPADVDVRLQMNHLYEAITNDEERNGLICNDVLDALKRGRSPLVLTERNQHLERLYELLSPHVPNLIMLRPKKMEETLRHISSMPPQEQRVLLATGKFVGEGFDDARLDTLFLTMPISWKGTVAQYVGRLHRLYEGKHVVQVYDYADLSVPVLERMFNRRCQGYEAVGYTILLPASAIPGWPSEVPLPVDPAWKADYAGSVRRLVLDGVDMPLAKLFVQASTYIDPEAEGVNRSRSATEGFLFRRLETLSQTKGKFQLNIKLNIPFDGWGEMEVDFLCVEKHLVIELDGSQHLGSADAYRRDRRKDALLQENGYMVLRFLTEDVGKQLDMVLDAILRMSTKT